MTRWYCCDKVRIFRHPGIGIWHQDNIRVHRFNEIEERREHFPGQAGEVFGTPKDNFDLCELCGKSRIAPDVYFHHRKIVPDLRGEPVVTFRSAREDLALGHEPLVPAHVHVEEIDPYCACFSIASATTRPAVTA